MDILFIYLGIYLLKPTQGYHFFSFKFSFKNKNFDDIYLQPKTILTSFSSPSATKNIQQHRLSSNTTVNFKKKKKLYLIKDF